jgi:hypothetical protein
MREAARIRRSGPAVAGALFLAASALALPTDARPGADTPRAAASAAGDGVSVKVLPTSQPALLARGAFRVRVTSAVPGVVKVTPRVGVPDARPARLGPARRVGFEDPGSKGLRLRLSRSGLALLAGCAERTLLVGARRAGPASARAVASVPLPLDRAACGPSGDSDPGSGTGGGGANGNVIPPPQPYTGPPIPTANSDRCDFLDAAICLQPWPNDYFTIADPATDTDRRVNLQSASMPKNQPLGSPVPVTPINPADYNRSDGFSPGNMLITKVPGLETPEAFENTDPVSIDDIAAYDDPAQPVVVINADTGERQPIWAELDSNAADPADANLLIRPAVNFDEGARYVVALRDLKNAAGQTIQPADAFRVYRDNLITTQAPVESRRAHMEELFETLGQAGIQRSSLYLAWDFTVASERNLSERALRIRDDAFAQLGDEDLGDLEVEGNPPAFSISSTDDLTPAENPLIGRIVQGSITVPCYLTLACSPTLGSTYNYGPDGLPAQNGTTTADFECIIPRAAVDGPDPQPSRVSLYGHGLLGSHTEVEGGNVQAMAAEHNITFCATDWFGFATQNVPNVLLILQDLSRFNTLADETQQGFLHFLYLGRALIHDDGFAANDAFKVGGEAAIDTSRLFYDGNSQGGILGGGLAALAPDYERAVLGVPGMNYSTLLQRSVDFEPYAEGEFTPVICDLFPAPLNDVCNLAPSDTPLGLYDNYPNEIERPLIFSLIQMLWDRGEANGYAHHMTDDPLTDTPAHEVLLHVAFGDHQVANVSAEVEARTIGASVYQPALDPGRYWDPSGIFGIPQVLSFPFGGSALVYWDGGPLGFPGGTATPPNEDVPPRPPEYGADPHSYPRNDVKARAQKSDFLRIGGVLNNYCTTANRPDPAPAALVPNTGTALPCYAHGWPGP